MVNVIINGAMGRMGKKVKEAVLSFKDVNAVCGVDMREDFSDKDFPVYSSFDGVTEKADVIIDFSAPACLPSVLSYAEKNKTGAVICTTGLTESDVKLIENAAERIPVFRSANMSLGVNVLINLVKKAAELLYGFDVEIIEKHHNKKKDAPSGTALMIADEIKKVYPEKYYVYGREGICGARKADEIGIHAIRGGNVVGEHDVLFLGENETVTLSHQATDRGVFAVGAVKAAIFLSGKQNGLYDMSDILK